MKRYYHTLPRPTDPVKVEQAKHLKRDMGRLMDANDEVAFLEQMKSVRPDISQEMLDFYREYFREQCRERQRNGPRRSS